MIFVGLLCVCLSTPVDIDEWFTISLSGTPAGWNHSVESVVGDVRTVHADETMTISRAGVEVTVRASTTWTDHLDGRPISME